MNTLNFSFVFLGQSVLKYQVPLDVYNILTISMKQDDMNYLKLIHN